MNRFALFLTLVVSMMWLVAPQRVRAQAYVTLDTPTTGCGTIKATGSFGVDSGYTLSTIVVYLLSSDGAYSSVMTVQTNLCGTFATNTVTVPNGSYTLIAVLTESICSGPDVLVNSDTETATVCGGGTKTGAGTVSIDTGSTQTGKGYVQVQGTYSTLSGFTAKSASLLVCTVKGGAAVTASVTLACGKWGPMKVSGLPANDYIVFVVMTIQNDSNMTLTQVNSDVTYKVTVK